MEYAKNTCKQVLKMVHWLSVMLIRSKCKEVLRLGKPL
jgi:hypothetical protein